jgi:hypothetical protein
VIPIFVGGTGRSGTTITLELLAQHSKVYGSNPLEIHLLTHNDGLLDSLDSLDLTKFKNKIEDTWLKQTKQTAGLYSSILKEDMDLMIKELDHNFKANPVNAIRVFYLNTFIKQQTIKDGSIYFGDSTPSTIRFSDKIKKIFPESKFINMYRDGRDSAYSMYKMRDNFSILGEKNEIDALRLWHKRMSDGNKALTNIDKESYISLRVEDLVSNDRDSSIKKILNFLNIEKEDEFINFFNNEVTEKSMSVGDWKNNLKNWKEFDNTYTEMINNLNKQGIFIEKYY